MEGGESSNNGRSSSSAVAAAAAMKKCGPLLGMVYFQVAYAAMFLITRLALSRGMSYYAFVLYRQIIAALTILPLAYYLRNRERRLTIRLKNVGQIFLLALLGIGLCQNCYYAGLAYTSSTFISTMSNLQPAITFLLAYLLRLEKVNIRRRGGQAKVLGTLLCVGGAMVMTVLKNDHNQAIQVPAGINAQMDPFPLPDRELLQLHVQDGGSFILGAFLTIVGTLSWSAFLIYQAWIVAEYPSQLTLSGLVSLMGSLQCAVISLSLENLSALQLHWDLQLLVIAYSGIFCAGFAVFVIMWCVKEKGPVYATAFNPMCTVLVAILEPLLLHVQLTWSSLTGMVIVIGGLYLFLWGKAQDGGGEANVNETSTGESSNQEPLLVKSNP